MATTTEAGSNGHYFGGPGDKTPSHHQTVGLASPLLDWDRQDRPCFCSVASPAEQDDRLAIVAVVASVSPLGRLATRLGSSFQRGNAHLQ